MAGGLAGLFHPEGSAHSAGAGLLRNLPTDGSMIVGLAAGSLREPMGVGRNASEELFRAAEVHQFAKPSDLHAEVSNYREGTDSSRFAAKG